MSVRVGVNVGVGGEFRGRGKFRGKSEFRLCKNTKTNYNESEVLL